MGFRLFTFVLLLPLFSLGTTPNLLAQTIDTYAGSGSVSWIGDGGPATLAGMTPAKLTFDAAGNCYFADYLNHVIRRVDAITGIITTVAGNGTPGFSGDGGAATSAQLNRPIAVAFDNNGNLYIADQYNVRIRMVDLATGIITTVAGNGTAAYTGDGGPATLASLGWPNDLEVDSSNRLYIADSANNCVRVVDLATGVITTFAGNGTQGYSGDGGPATLAQLDFPQDIGMDGDGNIYIAELGNHTVRRVEAATGVITTIAGTGAPGFSGDGGPATLAGLNEPNDIVVDWAGNVYIQDSANDRIRMVEAATGNITTVVGNGTPGFSGDGGPPLLASINYPTGMAFGPGNNLYFADWGNSRIRVVTNLIPVATPTPTVEPKCQGDMKVSKNRYHLGKDKDPLVIRVEVCLPSKYFLAIYNTAGEMVCLLRNQDNPSEMVEYVEWEGKNQTGEKVASGIYQIHYVNSFNKIKARVIVIR